ncbi:MAG: enoyl-CoA hydratase-related protein [Gemmataceae bacterium]
MSEPLLCRDRMASRVVTLTLNRPQAFNALSEAMLTELGEAFAALADDVTVRAVVLGASGKAFCAGHDLKEMRRAVARVLPDTVRPVHRGDARGPAAPGPGDRSVHGIATAAGCQLGRDVTSRWRATTPASP